MSMRIIRGLHNIQPADRDCVVTLGNFDGVHRGHQALLAQLSRTAPDARRCVVCFEPQPLEFLRPDQAPARLQNLSEKLRFLAHYGLEQVLVLPFNQTLAQMPADDFVQAVLVRGLAARMVVVGDDWRFGYQRRGDFALLQRQGQAAGFTVQQLDTVALRDSRVSSTRVRDALAAGKPALAKQCLGRNFRLRGRVIHGQKLGRKLSAPTANVALTSPSPLRHGVYCVRLDGQPAVANIGIRPTLKTSHGEHLEVHLLEGEHALYDRMVCVDFEAFVRPEQAFDGLPALQAAIAADVQTARQHFEQESA